MVLFIGSFRFSSACSFFVCALVCNRVFRVSRFVNACILSCFVYMDVFSKSKRSAFFCTHCSLLICVLVNVVNGMTGYSSTSRIQVLIRLIFFHLVIKIFVTGLGSLALFLSFLANVS